MNVPQPSTLHATGPVAMRARLVPVEALDVGEQRRRADGTPADLAAALAFVRAAPDTTDAHAAAFATPLPDPADAPTVDPLAAALGALGLHPIT